MTTPRTILRDSALALPLLAAVGAWLHGPWGALGVLASGAATLLNLAILGWIVTRLVEATAEGQGGGGAVAVIFGKTLAVLGVYGALVTVFPPIAVALGLGAGLIGITVRGLADARHLTSVEDA